MGGHHAVAGEAIGGFEKRDEGNSFAQWLRRRQLAVVLATKACFCEKQPETSVSGSLYRPSRVTLHGRQDRSEAVVALFDVATVRIFAIPSWNGKERL
jgi:hypothetical protein